MVSSEVKIKANKLKYLFSFLVSCVKPMSCGHYP